MKETTARQIEQNHNVAVDHVTDQYTTGNADDTYGWSVVPQRWIQEVEIEEGIKIMTSCLAIAYEIDPDTIIAVPEPSEGSEIMPKDYNHLTFDEKTNCHYYAPRAVCHFMQDLKIDILLKGNGQIFRVDQCPFETSGYRIERVKKHFAPMLADGWKIVTRKVKENTVIGDEHYID